MEDFTTKIHAMSSQMLVMIRIGAEVVERAGVDWSKKTVIWAEGPALSRIKSERVGHRGPLNCFCQKDLKFLRG